MSNSSISSIYKRCPFKKGCCTEDCALYIDDSHNGCVFLASYVMLGLIGEDAWYLAAAERARNAKKNHDDE